MKILHTADWHLGKIVNSVHMTEEQDYILNELITIIKSEEPDAVIVAGDLYDRAIPPKEAVELLNRILTKIIVDLKIPVLAIAGNHDSPDRLDFGSQLFRSQQLYIKSKLDLEMQPVVINDENGPVYFHLIPYVEPAEVRELFQDDSIHSHQTAMETIVNHITQSNDMTERHIFVGHAFIAGGMETESEERLSMIGGSPYINASLFKDFNYVALGHLHQAQRVKSDVVRYSGSILKYSFSEATHKKTVTLVNLNDEGTCTTAYLPLKPRYDLQVLEGYFDDLLNNPIENKEDYLHISLLDKGQIIDPMNKLRKIYPNILRLERKSLTSSKSLNDLQKIRQQQTKSHTELFAHFFHEVKGEEIPEASMQHIEKVVNQLISDERGE